MQELGIHLYLLDDSIEKNLYSPAQVDTIWGDMPYWAFAWSSGRALAKYILDNPQLVRDKTICDFGAGSGIVALAAIKAGAKAAWACDLDQQALLASQLNASKNGMKVSICTDISEVEDLDMLVVGDVLYDPRNHKLAQHLFSQQLPLIWAESQAQTKLAQYGPLASYQAQTYPNLGGFDEHKDIYIYHHKI
jgi:predicted nicotinamide N-methyase